MPKPTPRRHVVASLFALLAAMAIAVAGPTAAMGGLEARTVPVQLLAINDFHGNLDPPTGSSSRVNVPDGSGGVTTLATGGVTYLATHLDQLRQGHKNSITVSAGDNIGGSPLNSGYFHDEPAVEALNALGLDIATVGNHEFDEGPTELLRMQNGGCHATTKVPPESCALHTFKGADFDYLSANVVVHKTGKTLFPPYEIKNINGVRIAFIGVTLEGTPTIVTPAGTAGLDFLDEADTINKYVDELDKKQHVETFVVLMHQGGFQSGPGFINSCDGMSGDVLPIVQRLSSRVDVVISGHTHAAYNCTIPNNQGHNMLVTSAASFGRLVTDIELKIDRATKDVYAATATNVPVTRDVPTNAAEDKIVGSYNALISNVKNAVVGSITGDLTRTANPAGEQSLGDVIADSQLEATAGPFGAQIAFMNPGGIRADVVCTPGPPPCPVIFDQLFGTQPFGNDMWVKSLTGAQIKGILEQQFDNPALGQQRFLQVSSGFTYTWSQSAPTGSKVSNIRLNNVPLNPATSYVVAANAFLAGGGDNFTVFAQQPAFTVAMVDLDTMVAYFAAHSPVSPGPQNRVTVIP